MPMGHQILTILDKGDHMGFDCTQVHIQFMPQINLRKNNKIIEFCCCCCMFVKVVVCSSMETTQRFVLKQVEGEENAFAVRKVGLS